MCPARVLSLWFPRLAAERLPRAEPQLAGRPLAVVEDRRGALLLASLTAAAEAAGLRRGMALGDARAILPALVTRPADAAGLARTRTALRRWAGRFTPWVAEEQEALVLDVTGCAALFGGEAGLVGRIAAEAAGFGFSLRLGLADTLGAAWAVARYAGASPLPVHAGDAIDQEARATRSRAQKRHRDRGGPPPVPAAAGAAVPGIVPPGATLAAIAGLPVAALRLEAEAVERLQALGIARVGTLAGLPRAAVARRFGPGLGRRLDQALGRTPEPVSPAPPEPVFALRLGFPEPIGRSEDVLAGLDRLLPALAGRLRAAGKGARRVRLTLVRTDGTALVREAGLARPADRPERIRPLLALQLDAVDAGFGIETMRIEATAIEPVAPRQACAAVARPAGDDEDGLADLLGRIGIRLEAPVRLHPADSHIPEKAATEMAAAFSEPARGWPAPPGPRPILLFPPEPVADGAGAPPPRRFVWRRRPQRGVAVFGPERITPEWWLDDPAWRSGPRDYWRVETEEGTRLWLFEAKGGETGGGWFVHGLFA